MHAEKCPICEGSGKLPDLMDESCYKVCHGCDGKGWVEVNDAPKGWISHPCETTTISDMATTTNSPVNTWTDTWRFSVGGLDAPC